MSRIESDVYNRRAGVDVALPYSRMFAGLIPWYGILVTCGMGLSIWLAGREEKRLGLPADTAVDLALVVIPFGVLGARVYYVLMSWGEFESAPLSVFYIWNGGLAIYGGVIGGIAAAWIYARRKNLSFSKIADMVAPGLLLAQGVGRWGNYFNMEAYGPQITEPSLQFFPFGVLIPSAAGNVWHMATFFYESLWNLTGFCMLWGIRKKQKDSGNIFCWYLLIYGSGRFVIEQLRQDSLYIGSFRASQWLSLVLCITAAVILLKRSFAGTRKFITVTACTVLWLLRWSLLDEPAFYALVLLITGMVSIWLLRNEKSIRLLVMMLALDVAGLLVYLAKVPAADFVHSLLCSLTLVGYVMALCMKNKDER